MAGGHVVAAPRLRVIENINSFSVKLAEIFPTRMIRLG